MIQLKNEGIRARVGGISNEMLFAVLVIHSIFRDHGINETTLTAVAEPSKNRRKGSRHLLGHAVDVRTRDFDPLRKADLTEKIAEALGPDYDVVLESSHLHVEYDPEPLPFPEEQK